jgi:high-affinity iron transporter
MRNRKMLPILCFTLSILHFGLSAAGVARAAGDSVASQLFESNCAFCHGAEGKGDGVAGKALDPPPADFTSSDFWRTMTPDKLRDAILNGKPGTAMVPFRNTLKAEEIDALVKYLHTFAPH